MKTLPLTLSLLSSSLIFSQSLECTMSSESGIVSAEISLSSSLGRPAQSEQDSNGDHLLIVSAQEWKTPYKNDPLSNYGEFRSVSIINGDDEKIVDEFMYMSLQDGVMLDTTIGNKNIVCTSSWY